MKKKFVLKFFFPNKRKKKKVWKERKVENRKLMIENTKKEWERERKNENKNEKQNMIKRGRERRKQQVEWGEGTFVCQTDALTWFAKAQTLVI